MPHPPPAVRGGHDIRADREAARGGASRSANPQSGRARSAGAGDSQSDGEGAGRPIPDRGADARRAGSDRMRLAFAIITLFATGRLAAQRALSPRPYRPGVDVLDYAVSLNLPDSGN